MLGAAWLTVLAGSASVALPITGGFGLQFDEPVAADVLGASIGHPPYPLPPDNLPQDALEQPPGAASGWHYFIPRAVPELLDKPTTQFRVLLDGVGRPVRIEAQDPAKGCEEAFDWITDSLTKKYRTTEDPAMAPRAGFSRGARFVYKRRQVDVGCGRGLLIEYVDGSAFERWRAARQSALAEHRAEESRLERIAADLAREERLRFADAFTVGDRFRLDGALGVVFGEPVDAPADYTPDAPWPVALPELPAPFDAGSYELTVGPDRVPIRLQGKIADGTGAIFDAVSAALHSKYGTPLKDGARHKVYRVNGNFFILRRLERLGELDVVVIDKRAETAQKARAEALARREFEAATQGL